MMFLLGSFLILIQLICVQSNKKNIQNELNINIVNTEASDLSLIDSNDFIKGLFAKYANNETTDKVVQVGYKNNIKFETSETGCKYKKMVTFILRIHQINIYLKI